MFGELIPYMKQFLWKHENLNLIPRTHVKPAMLTCGTGDGKAGSEGTDSQTNWIYELCVQWEIMSPIPRWAEMKKDI